MGISYVAIAGSLDALASVYSSRDEALFERVLASEHPQVRHYLQAACARDEIRPETVLADIFRGTALTACRPHVYAYALLAGAFEALVRERWAEVFPRAGATATFWRRT